MATLMRAVESPLVKSAAVFYFPPMTTLLENRPDAAMPAASPAKPSLAGMTKAELMAALASAGVAHGHSKMRAAQLWNWIYARGAQDFSELSNIAKSLR